MHSLRSKRGLIAAIALALGIALALPSTASAGPETGAKRGQGRGFRLFARPLGAITINRVYMGLSNQGLVGVDSTNSSTIPGGFWPKGTPNGYIFNSGLQVAGIIQGTKPGNPWGGDTTGGFFFDPKGTTEHGVGLTDIFNATNPADAANWPQGAFVPQGDESEEIFNPLLRGRVSAGQGDVWWMSWEGDPGLNAGRSHPLGIAAEYRGMGWNYPSGNEDIVYFVLTFYNITSLNPADYAQYRPGVREILVQAAQDFHSLNNARFSITLPPEGYTIGPMYSAFAADMDIANAGANFASVNLPFALGYAYEADFSRFTGWQFDPAIFGAPFFSGSGFVGVKYLKGPDGPGVIQLFGNTTNGGAFSDAANVTRLFRFLKGDVLQSAGDPQCNNGDPRVTRICYIAPAAPFDVRFFQSSPELNLEPGGSGSIVVAYIHAAPVAIPGYVPGTRVLPQDATRLTDPARLSLGANRIDSLTGFRGWNDGVDGNGIVEQSEFTVVPRSLLGKALVAQTVFDNRFLLPFAPEAPEFFLIPGDNQVTVLWKPSASETTGDAFFEIASSATVIPEGGGAPVVNPLYDANYRQFDVEGYRIYRGRVDSPSSLRLIAQFDYSGTQFRDFTGQVVTAFDPAHPAEPFTLGNCAPDLGLFTGCPVAFGTQTPGVPLTVFINREINAPLVQVPVGGRTRLFSGDVLVTAADTAVTGLNSGFPALSNTGVPFVYIDNDVRNGLTYYYAVTAFDVNSIRSGPTSLESPRTTQRVTPGTTAGNYVNTAEIQAGMFGRNGLRTDNAVPTIDPATGKFSKRFPVATGTKIGLAGFVRELLAGPGEVSMTLDSISLISQSGDVNNIVRHFTLTTPNGSSKLSLPMAANGTSTRAGAAGSFNAITADPALAARYGGSPGYTIAGSYTDTVQAGYRTGVMARGCVNNQAGFGTTPSCYYNGPRWFIGDNETKDHPNAGNTGAFTTNFATTNFNNAGELAGVVTIHMPVSYNDRPGAGWRNVEAAMAPLVGAADYRVYWGAGGVVDSVIDLTHDVVVPFRPDVGVSWGFLNGGAVPAAQSYDQRAVLTASDIGCVAPLKTLSGIVGNIPCTGAAVPLSTTAVPGPIAFTNAFLGGNAADRTEAAAANNGVILYIHGRMFLIELEGGSVPAAGTQWTMRDYTGAIAGGQGSAGLFGNYVYTTDKYLPPGAGADGALPLFQFTAVGASVKYAFDLVNEIRPSSQETLAKIHTVPDPYYVTNAFETTTTSKVIKFVNLPEQATIRIYSASGVLVRMLKQNTTSFAGELTWDVRNRNNQFVASGVYFYHVEAENGESTVGRMTIVNYVQ